MNKQLKVAVIGVGHLGQHHARILHELDCTDLIGVVDIDQERGRQIAGKCQTQYYECLDQLPDEVEAVSVATPTENHLETARQAIRRGWHLMVEKPIAMTVQQAEEIVSLAHQQGVRLQVGHIERFNSAVIELRNYLNLPRFVESHRLGPLAPRVKDIGVVKDLMIHDLDLVLSLVNSSVRSVQAVGIPVLTRFEDIANARIEFENGCIANFTVSRVTPEQMRKIRFFQQDAYLSLDYQQQELQVYRKVMTPQGGMAGIEREIYQMEKTDALRRELLAFVESVQTGSRPVVTGEDGLRALALAEEISRQIEIWTGNESEKSGFHGNIRN